MHRPWVWYGNERVSFELPPGVSAETYPPTSPAAAADPMGVVAAALDEPLGSQPLAVRAQGVERVVVVVPDGTRTSAAGAYLMPVLSRLAQAGLTPRHLRIVLARSLRPSRLRADVSRVVGQDVMASLDVVQSAPDAPAMNVELLQDEHLGPVSVHRVVADADLVVLTSEVAPHPLVGFRGGATVLVPGVALRETAVAAHRLALRTVLRPDGGVEPWAGRLEPNPLRSALTAVAEEGDRCFLLAVVLTEEGEIAAARAGKVGAAHAAGIDAWLSLHDAGPIEPADLVVAGARLPQSWDLYQAYEGLVQAHGHARPGAPVVWAVEAPAGPGPTEFVQAFQTRRLENQLAALRREFHPAALAAYLIRRIARERPVCVVSEVERDLLRPMGLLPFRDVQAAVDHALAQQAVATCRVEPDSLP